MIMPRRSSPRAPRRTNAELTAETRAKIVAAARKVFATSGFQAASGEEIVAKAGVTRGALYYQFGDMDGLFAAVADAVARELVAELYAATMSALPKHKDGVHAIEELEIGADLLLKAFATRDAADLLLREAPVVLGHAKWNALMESSGLRGLVDHALGHWVEASLLPAKRKEATAQLIFGALSQAGLAIAAAPNRAAALTVYREAAREMIRGLRAAKGGR
jgi:AcrR family transcriptional regulator